MKKTFNVICKSSWYLMFVLWFLVEWSCRLAWLLIKGSLWLFGVRFTKKIKEPEPLPMIFPDEEKEEAVARVGSIVPVEEDVNLRTFNILNAEGEIYRINTALPGQFHGPVWTRILGCYETQQTLAGRLVRPVYDPNHGLLTGYSVLIGKVKAFLPVAESLLPAEQKPINVRVAVTSVDPAGKKLAVSVKRAYQILFAKKTIGQTGEETDALFWDYDDEFVYLLLPGEYVGQARYTEPVAQVAAWMARVTRCRLDSVHAEEQTAIVSIDPEKGEEKTAYQPDEAAADLDEEDKEAPFELEEHPSDPQV